MSRGRRGATIAVVGALLALPLLGDGDGASSGRWFDIAPRQITTVAGATMSRETRALDVALYGVRGLVRAADGRDLYLIDQGRGLVVRLDVEARRIHHVAGREIAGWNGDGHAALDTSFHVLSDLALDPRTGNLIVADTQNHRVREIAADGSRVWTVAGLGVRGHDPASLPTEFPFDEAALGGFSGDGGPALDAELNQPGGVTVDDAGNLWIADSENHRIRVVNRQEKTIQLAGVEMASGAISTIAGDGTLGFRGDGGPAVDAHLAYPLDLEVVGDALLFVDGFNQRLRRIDLASGVIDTVAEGALKDVDPEQAADDWSLSIVGLGSDGHGGVVYSDRVARRVYALRGNGDEEVVVAIQGPVEGKAIGLGSVVGDRHGVILADVYHNRVIAARRDGSSVIAGGASPIEGIPATEAAFSVLGPIEADAEGNLYVPDAFHYSVRRIDAGSGAVETLVGQDRIGVRGDGGSPRDAELVHPTDVRVAPNGVIYIVDQYANAVRRILPGLDDGFIETFVAADTAPDPLGPDPLRLPLAAAVHPRTGELYVATQGTHSIYRITADGTRHLYAGTGRAGFGGDGGSGLWASFNWPSTLRFDASGNLYVSDLLNHRIRKISTDRIVTTLAGTGDKTWNGDGKPARETSLSYPAGLAFGPDGALYVADSNHHRVRRIDPAPPHRVSTVIGTGVRGFAGDGGAPLEAELNLPRGLVFGPDGVLFVVDAFNRRVRAARVLD